LLYVQVLNHGLSPDDLNPRYKGARLAVLGMRIQSVCLSVVAPGSDDVNPPPGEAIVDVPFHATFGGGDETPLIVLADILSWPAKVPESERNGLSKTLAEALGQMLAAYFTSGRKLHVSVRTPDHAEASSWSR
jgi:hypothetical protein